MRRVLTLTLILLSAATANAKKDRTATLLYITDAHEVAPVVDRLGDRGGVARLKTVVDRVRLEDKQAQLLFGGDLAGGVLFGAVFRGEPTVEALNRVGVNAATFGQHDFDFGAEQTRKLIDSSRFPWFTSNLEDETGEPFAGLETVHLLQVHGIRIGLLGITGAMDSTTPGTGVKQLGTIESARKGVRQLQEMNAEVIVALTQLPLEENAALLDSLPEIDALLSEERSETHSMVYYVGERPIATPGGNLASVIRFDVILPKSGDPEVKVSVLKLDNTVVQDAGLKQFADSLMQELEERLAEPVARLTAPLESGIYSDNRSRWGESIAGNLVADAYRAYYGTDVGIIQGGGLRSNAPAGELTLREVMSLLPFYNRVTAVRVKGEVLLAALEHGVSAVKERSGRLLQVSGISYTYDPKKPVGERIVEVMVGGEPLDLAQEYTIAMPRYLQGGGDGFEMFREAEIVAVPGNEEIDSRILEEYCRRLGTITPALENRIIILGDQPTE